MACKHGKTSCVCSDCDMETIERLSLMSDKVLLKLIAKQLEDWAKEALQGGWSTHQVKAQRDLADKIYMHLGKS